MGVKMDRMSLTKHNVSLSDIQNSIYKGARPSEIRIWKVTQPVWHLDVPPEVEESTKNVEWAYGCVEYDLPGGIDIDVFTKTYPLETLSNFFDKRSLNAIFKETKDAPRMLIYENMELDWSEEE